MDLANEKTEEEKCDEFLHGFSLRLIETLDAIDDYCIAAKIVAHPLYALV
jgi:hypothetical protein